MGGNFAPRYLKSYISHLSSLTVATIVLFSILMCPALALSADVTLAWDPPETGQVDGYKLFYREQDQDYNYSQRYFPPIEKLPDGIYLRYTDRYLYRILTASQEPYPGGL